MSPSTASTTYLLVCPPLNTGTALRRERLLRAAAGFTRKAVLTLGIPHTTVKLPVSRSLILATMQADLCCLTVLLDSMTAAVEFATWS